MPEDTDHGSSRRIDPTDDDRGTPRRRTVLAGIAAGGLGAIAGCADVFAGDGSGEPTDTTPAGTTAGAPTTGEGTPRTDGPTTRPETTARTETTRTETTRTETTRTETTTRTTTTPPPGLDGEDCLRFDPGDLELAEDAGGWVLTDGTSRLLTFPNEAEGESTLDAIRTYGFDRFCFVGRPDPAMTYWLDGGRAAEVNATPAARDCLGFDRYGLTLEPTGSNWTLRDGSSALLSFSDGDEARRSLEVISHYGFDLHCFVGRPDPSMEYWLSHSAGDRDRPRDEDCLTFDPDALELREEDGNWVLAEGNDWLLSFPNRSEGETALSVVERHGFDEQCFVGRPDPGMSYWLSDGRPPRVDGTDAEPDPIAFDPLMLRVERQASGDYTLLTDRIRLASFPAESEARFALRAIRIYGFNTWCYVGRPDASMEYLLVDTSR